MAFQNNQPERIVLGDENGAHIVLDSGINAIQLWDGTTIVGELRAPDMPFDMAFRLASPGDTDARFLIRGDGGMFWGPGNAGQDANLYRSGPFALQMDSSLTVDSQLNVNGAAILNSLQVPGLFQFDGRVEYNSTAAPRYLLGIDEQLISNVGIPFPNSAAALTPTLVPGLSWTFDVTQSINKIDIDVNLQCRNTNYTAGVVFLGTLMVDGVADSDQIIYQPTASLGRVPASRSWTLTNLAPGSHTIEVWANLSAVPPTGYSIEPTAKMRGKVYE